MGFTYRHSTISHDWIFTEALFQGTAGEPADILRAMDEVAEYARDASAHQRAHRRLDLQEPEGHSAWKLIDDAGCRGFRVGGAMVSEKHCNFLINDRNATGEDIERLGEIVRARVKAKSGITLQWEIIRLGRAADGRAEGEALAEMVG